MEASGDLLLGYSRKKYHLHWHHPYPCYSCRLREYSWALMAPSIGHPPLEEVREPTTGTPLPPFAIHLKLLSMFNSTTLETHNPWKKVVRVVKYFFSQHPVPSRQLRSAIRFVVGLIVGRYVWCPRVKVLEAMQSGTGEAIDYALTSHGRITEVITHCQMDLYLEGGPTCREQQSNPDTGICFWCSQRSLQGIELTRVPCGHGRVPFAEGSSCNVG